MNGWWDFKNGGQSELGEPTWAKTMKQGDKTAAHTGRYGVEAAWLSRRGPRPAQKGAISRVAPGLKALNGGQRYS